jgi:hypothetical protein
MRLGCASECRLIQETDLEGKVTLTQVLYSPHSDACCRAASQNLHRVPVADEVRVWVQEHLRRMPNTTATELWDLFHNDPASGPDARFAPPTPEGYDKHNEGELSRRWKPTHAQCQRLRDEFRRARLLDPNEAQAIGKAVELIRKPDSGAVLLFHQEQDCSCSTRQARTDSKGNQTTGERYCAAGSSCTHFELAFMEKWQVYPASGGQST